MRDIKFRAIEQKNGKRIWRYGTYAHTVMYPTSFRGHYVDDTQIDETTLGQYTGLKDKNGKEIYEGDIIVCNHPVYDGSNTNNSVEFKSGCWKLVADSKADIPIYNYNSIYLEVIGNIHQNLELLK